MKRSLLDRYDHEFAFRLMVAEQAKAGAEAVSPFHVSECQWCVWQPHCAEVAGAGDASFAIRTGFPSAQQWRYLYDSGITTVNDLAAQNPDSCPEGWSRRDTQPGTRAHQKYRTLVRRARMAHAGIDYESSGEWPEVPSADVEVDFDIEWDGENRIYLWGLRVRQGQDDTTAVFDPVVCYDPIDDTAADELAAEFATRLGAVIANAEAAGKSVKVFHWSHPERSKTSKYPVVAALLEGRAFDLHAWFNRNFLTCDGASIKGSRPDLRLPLVREGCRWGPISGQDRPCPHARA